MQHLPCRYISSPSPKGSPHLVHRAHVGWKWWLSPACTNTEILWDLLNSNGHSYNML